VYRYEDVILCWKRICEMLIELDGRDGKAHSGQTVTQVPGER